MASVSKIITIDGVDYIPAGASASSAPANDQVFTAVDEVPITRLDLTLYISHEAFSFVRLSSNQTFKASSGFELRCCSTSSDLTDKRLTLCDTSFSGKRVHLSGFGWKEISNTQAESIKLVFKELSETMRKQQQQKPIHEGMKFIF